MSSHNHVSWTNPSLLVLGLALAMLLLNLTGGMAQDLKKTTEPNPKTTKSGKGPNENSTAPNWKDRNSTMSTGNTTRSNKNRTTTTHGANQGCAKSPEAVCSDLEKAAPDSYKECVEYAKKMQNCRIPKHLNPPWLEHKDSSNAMDGAWYACGTDKETKQDYCACAYDKAEPDPEFNKLLANANLQDNCLDNFFKVAMMPMCGNGWYDHVKHCAFFYDNKPKEDPKGGDSKSTLVLLDGCLVNAQEGCVAKFSVKFQEPAGSFFTKCSEATIDAIAADGDSVGTAVPKGASKKLEQGPNVPTFTLPFILVHRRCKGIISDDDISNEFSDIKLTITGCGEDKTIDLPNLNADKGRVQEMRGLQLDMESGTAMQWRDDADTEGYNYELKKGDGALKWLPTELKQIGEFGKPKGDGVAFYG